MEKQYYLIHIQYLGFRYHGWLKQPNVKTVESMVEKTLKFILGHDDFKILGSSRTDSKVSANHSAFELFLKQTIDTDAFLKELNDNLPNDIRALDIESVDKMFSIINAPRIKEYIYLFACGEKAHPFSAPLMYTSPDVLDIDLMKEGALLFEGRNNFAQYCTKPKPETQFEREVLFSRIEENSLYTANFFPRKSYVYHIHSKGFLRYQVRLIMGQLLSLGRGEIDIDGIKKTLNATEGKPLRYIAPASGLILNKIDIQK